MADTKDTSQRFQYTERDLLIQVRQDLKNFIAEVKEQNHSHVSSVKDHEHRLRILENFRWWIVGLSVGAAFVGNIVAKFVLH